MIIHPRKLLLTGMAVVAFSMFSCADSTSPLVWQTAYGTMGLPLDATEILMGYDGILKQTIGGASVPFYTDPKNIVVASVGAIAPWPNPNGVAIEPYLALGHDILKEIPYLSQFNSAHLNIFGRYASTQGGKFGAGLSFSYAFGGGSLTASPPVPTSAPVSTPVPTPS
jgi:hypothetical protein